MVCNQVVLKYVCLKGWVNGAVKEEDGKKRRLQRDSKTVDLGKFIKNMNKICMN